LLVLFLALAALGDSVRAQPPAVSFRLITNTQNPTTAVERRFVADAFLKKVTRWGDGETIRPVDLTSEAPTRIRFCDEILKRSVSAVKSFWQQVVFSGRDVPPPELDSVDEVIAYVQRFRGAVGYVSGAANVEHVRVLVLK
jgi:hypothetical protein